MGSVFLLFLLASSLIGGVWWVSVNYSDYIKNFINQYYVIQESVNILGGALTTLIGILFISTIKPILNKIKSSKNELDSMECEFADYTISLKNFNEEKEKIIKHIDCQSYDDVVEKFNKLSTEKSLYDEKNKLINYDIEQLNSLEQDSTEIKNSLSKSLSILGISEINSENIKKANEAYSRKDSVKEEISKLKSSIEQLNQSIVKLDKEISFEEKRLSMILSSNGMEDLDSFKEAAQYSEKYTELTNNKSYKEGILNKIIGYESFEDL